MPDSVRDLISVFDACERILSFVNDTAPTEIYTLSLHDALPIWSLRLGGHAHEVRLGVRPGRPRLAHRRPPAARGRVAAATQSGRARADAVGPADTHVAHQRAGRVPRVPEHPAADQPVARG